MTQEINKNYVAKYIEQAKSTASEALRNDCLYRAGTHMEVIWCDGNANLTPQEQQRVFDAAEQLAKRENA